MEDDALGQFTAPEREEQRPTNTPLVTAVVTAENPGEWFEEVLMSLVTQDYERLRVVVLDADATTPRTGTEANLEWRVRSLLPRAEIVAVPSAEHYAEAANEAMKLPGRGQFLLLCQDHVALAPDAVRLMVEEAVRSNAGIVGPKLVMWDDPRRIVEVGVAIDKLGVPAPYAEVGEFDQEQHDAVRDVFGVSGAAMLIRSDLFEALDGYDTGMPHRGFDIDLCWRARAAGARVMIAPRAVGRSGTDAAQRLPSVSVDKLVARSGMRSMLSNYSVGHLLRVVPQGMLLGLATMIWSVLNGRFSAARQVVSTWLYGLTNLGSVAQRRSKLGAIRNVPDSEVRRFQVRGFESVNRRIRERGAGKEGRFGQVSDRAKSREIQTQLGVWMLVLGTVWFGSRRLFSGQVPVINQFGTFRRGPVDLLSSWFSSLRPGGLGTEGFAPTLELFVGVLGVLTFGQMGLLRTLLTVGMIVLGALGMYRFMAPFRSLMAQVAAPLIYVAVPLGYNSLVNGSWRALLLLGGLPWIMKWLVASAGIAPFAKPVDVWVWGRNTLVAAVWVALVAAGAPIVGAGVAIIVVGLSLGGIFTGRPGPIWRLALSAVAACAGAFILHLPLEHAAAHQRRPMGVLHRWSFGSIRRSCNHGPVAISDGPSWSGSAWLGAYCARRALVVDVASGPSGVGRARMDDRSAELRCGMERATEARGIWASRARCTPHASGARYLVGGVDGRARV